MLRRSVEIAVKSGHDAFNLRCPLYPQQRTFLDAVPMSALGQKQTHALQQKPLFDLRLLHSLSALWSAQAEITLGAENITVKACNPLPSAGGNVQVLNGGLDMR